MKILFSKKGSNAFLAEKERRIFLIGDSYYDASGNETPYEPGFFKGGAFFDDDEKEEWYEYWMDDEGLDEPLKAESTTEVRWEPDDTFGTFGFRNEAGKFVIEPQYAYAHNFTLGLAAVNLNRTWYRSEDGDRWYENHFGYIDGRGKTAIGFRFSEAYPFNKYGVAVVSEPGRGWLLIDTEGREIPGTDFPYLDCYYEYDTRFLEFSYERNDYGRDQLVGIYDTKERKILLEPSIDSISECNEDLILVYERGGQYGESDFRQHYINSRGETLFPWLCNKDFAIVEVPDKNGVTAVAISEYTELTGHSSFYFLSNGKKYERRFIYGLYSSKGKFLLPLEYDKIKNIDDNLWCCVKEGVVTVIETEDAD